MIISVSLQNQTIDKQNKVMVTSENTLANSPNGHEAIDLGLPSGTKWASCNVGTTTPEAYGCYFAWGETTEKEVFGWDTYIHCDGSKDTCHDLGESISGTEYDVANMKWGGNWQMPTLEQLEELLDNCDYEWMTREGIEGGLLTSKINGNIIFFPAAGIYYGPRLGYRGEFGHYWLGTQDWNDSFCAFSLRFYRNYAGWNYNDNRNEGLSVRPVWIDEEEGEEE